MNRLRILLSPVTEFITRAQGPGMECHRGGRGEGVGGGGGGVCVMKLIEDTCLRWGVGVTSTSGTEHPLDMQLVWDRVKQQHKMMMMMMMMMMIIIIITIIIIAMIIITIIIAIIIII